MANRNYPKNVSATTVIPFDNPVTYIPAKTVTGPLTFTKTTTGAQAGYTAILRVIANGSNTPDLSAFKSIGTGTWDNTNGVVNQLWFVFDGVDYCVAITHPVAITGGGGGTDTTPPTMVSATLIDSTHVRVVFSESMGSVTGSGWSFYDSTTLTTYGLDTVTGSGTTWDFHINSYTAVSTDTYTISYAPSSGSTTDAASNELGVINNASVTNSLGSGGGSFTSTNRVAFYKNSTKTVSGTDVTKWANADGDTSKDYSLSDGGYPQDGGANGLTFDGTLARKLYMATIPTTLNAPMTIYVRVKIAAYPSCLFSPAGSSYGIFFDTANTYFNPNGSGYGVLGVGVSSGTWHTVVITWDGSSANKVYVDGTLIGTAAGAPAGTNLDYATLNSQTTGGYFNGNVLGLAIFSAVHDATTIGTQTTLFNTEVA
jgi:hypothetical protein